VIAGPLPGVFRFAACPGNPTSRVVGPRYDVAWISQLEADLLARWGREELAVYADYLQSIGDPRGEVIAIDLVNLDTVDETAWRTRRTDAMVTWLGSELAHQLGGMIFQGFIQETTGDAMLLASAAGEFVRAFRSGDRDAIQRLVAHPRPWLTRIAIQSDTELPLISDALCERLVAATPRLDQIVLRGSNVVGKLSHPHVRHVLLDGPTVTALCWRGDWLTPPAAFEIERVREQSPTADSRLYLRPSAEAMHVCNEPAIQRHVTHLRIGKPPSHQRFVGNEVTTIERFVGALPRLAVLEVALHGSRLDMLRTAVTRVRPQLAIVVLDR
jgi:hypothetical protein